MADRFFMNKQHEAHLRGTAPATPHKGASDVQEETGQHTPPHIHVHPHSKGVTVHVMHHDGRHEKHEHGHGDMEGIAAHIHQHLGATGNTGGEEQGEEDYGAAGL